MIIKTKNDARRLAEKIAASVYGGGFHDSTISMVNGGGTSIWEEDEIFYIFSQGPGWRDQAPTEIGNIEAAADFIWRHRRDINAALREGIFWY